MIGKTLGWSLFAGISISLLWMSAGAKPPITTIETVGFLSGLIWIWFLIKENPWGWPAGILSSSTYVYFFYQGKLYGDAALNALYVVLGVLGWYWWSRGIDRTQHLQIDHVRASVLITLAVASAVGAALLVPHFLAGDSPVPVPDAVLFCSALSAQYLQARKKIENWPFWIAVNSGYVAIYLYKGWVATAVLTTVYALMAIAGWRSWALKMNKKEATSV